MVSLLSASTADVKPAKSTLKLPNTGSTNDSPSPMMSFWVSGANTVTANSVVALGHPTRYTNVPSIGSAVSPDVTAVPPVKVNFSEPAIMLADNFRFVSSAV